MHSLLSVCFLVGAALGATTVPIPDNDPFYKPPTGFESSAPGTVFSNRSVYSGTDGVTAVQVLYRTTLINGTATATVATILTGPASTGTKLVSYADDEDALNSICADSYLYYTNNTGSMIPLDSDTNNMIASGATVVVADYEGPNSAFTAGRQGGYAVLDGLRAALNYAPAGLKKTAAVGGYGYSGGAIPTGWAASLQPTYAPELNVKGWALGGTPANLTSTFQTTIFAGLSFAGVAGQMAAYPAASERLAQILTAKGVAALASVKSQCRNNVILGFLFADLETTEYQTLGDRLFYDPVLAAVLQNSTMGVYAHETPTAPVYMFHGQYDELAPHASAQTAANAWCARGASVEFVSETGGAGHVGTMFAMSGSAATWLDLRLGGAPPAAGCANTSFAELGVPLKRGGDGAGAGAGSANVTVNANATRTALETFGTADSFIVGNMMVLRAAGQAVPSLWSFLSWKL